MTSHTHPARADPLDSALQDAKLTKLVEDLPMKRRTFLMTGAAATLAIPVAADTAPLLKVLKTTSIRMRFMRSKTGCKSHRNLLDVIRR